MTDAQISWSCGCPNTVYRRHLLEAALASTEVVVIDQVPFLFNLQNTSISSRASAPGLATCVSAQKRPSATTILQTATVRQNARARWPVSLSGYRRVEKGRGTLIASRKRPLRRGMGSELELTERERARQSAVLESAVQRLSQNVTSQADEATRKQEALEGPVQRSRQGRSAVQSRSAYLAHSPSSHCSMVMICVLYWYHTKSWCTTPNHRG